LNGSLASLRARIRMPLQPALAVLLSIAVLGCATTDCAPPMVGRGITPNRVAASAEAEFAGTMAQWGGVLLARRHERDRTVLEVLGHPLDDCGRPGRAAASTGRFLIVHPGYLETADFEPGRLITAAGRILGSQRDHSGGASSALPMIESNQLRLWPPEQAAGFPLRPWVSIGIGGGHGGVHGGVGGGVGILF